jgi:hypothetical protein
MQRLRNRPMDRSSSEEAEGSSVDATDGWMDEWVDQPKHMRGSRRNALFMQSIDGSEKRN